MNDIFTLLEQYNSYIIIALSVLLIITFILAITTMIKLKKIQSKYEKFMSKEDLDLENLLIHYATKVNDVRDSQDKIESEIKNLYKQMESTIQKLGVVRYNAYEKGGADLSFAIAFLNEHDTGVVINGIYSRDGSYIYAKPIENGLSKHNLSEEEIEAIEKAKNTQKAISK